jgi:hypothetical protein
MTQGVFSHSLCRLLPHAMLISMSALEVYRLRINPARTWRSLQFLQTGNPGNVVALRGPARSTANLAAHVQAEPGKAVNPMATATAPGTK